MRHRWNTSEELQHMSAKEPHEIADEDEQLSDEESSQNPSGFNLGF